MICTKQENTSKLLMLMEVCWKQTSILQIVF
jgi:hypothetical protein